MLLDNARIVADADAGNGGDINISADFLLSSQSDVSSDSVSGSPGVISIDVAYSLANTVAKLPGDVVDEDEVEEGLQPSKVPGDHSTFGMGGRGGVPVDPGGYLPSQRLWDLPPPLPEW